ncbi:MAG: serine/threonine protein kinase [Acidobacteria bacterium]|nr:serine/threonine protein kinase [Acidobacteriota bacterium]
MSLIGRTIGKIRIVEELGKGGMGEVYVGYDEKLEREVAVKVISGTKRMDAASKERFSREAKLLSQLEHVNICRIYDFFEDENGDVLVLELIRGKDLSTVAPTLSWKEKLSVAEQIAAALQLAHARNIVHRDLKPENVMIQPNGQVKVLDFGLARAVGDASVARDTSPIVVELDGREIELEASKTLDGMIFHTEHGAIMGTPMFMSPEQALGDPVTAASDMYAFGLLLQWLFTGVYPHPKGVLGAALLIRAMKGESQPVAGLDAQLTSLINRLKSTSPEGRPVATDTLDRIIWIRTRPARMFRNIAVAAIVVSLAIGTLFSTTGFIRAKRSEQKALASEQRAIASESEARLTVQLLKEFLTSVDPSKQGTDLKVIDLIEGFKPRLEELDDQPLIKASLLETYGELFTNLGFYEETQRFYERAIELRKEFLGDEHLDTLTLQSELSHVFYRLRQFEKGEALARHVLPIITRTAGEEHPLTLRTHTHHARNLFGLGRHEEAVEIHKRVLAIQARKWGEEHPDCLSTQVTLAYSLSEMGRYDEALALSRKTLEISERVLGAEDVTTLNSQNNIAYWLIVQGHIDEAEPYAINAVQTAISVWGQEHPNTLSYIDTLAFVLEKQQKIDEAIEWYKRAASGGVPESKAALQRLGVPWSDTEGVN